MYVFANVLRTLALKWGVSLVVGGIICTPSVRVRWKAYPLKSIYKARDFEEQATQTDSVFFLLIFFFRRNSTHCETPWGVTLSSFI